MLIANNVIISAPRPWPPAFPAFFGNAGVVYATAGMSILVIVFAEIMPKTVAINDPDRAALALARPVSFFVALFGPVTMAIEWFVRQALKPSACR
jgi:Mg2+/Co2+ transporter CorB